jgi:2'-5' RNA ligase
MMRLFVALDMDAGVLERLADFQKKLRRQTALSGREVKWVRPEQMHLTLKFLGPVDDDDVTRVCTIVQETANRYDAFELTCRGVGVFGRPARVVWAAAEGGHTLKTLQRELDDRFTQAGWAAENRAFTAHLTLCRVKSAAAGRVLAEAIEAYEQEEFGSTWVDSLVVYESRLSAAGPEYHVVSRSQMR